ncbi:hypothetical protein [Acinetobacter baumannii]|uniref:hypothetical protein n=1 Tax=Acinetobacter baumannii TaxID=470 RepID=UPI001D181C83|nr:hypothetical protein [Acinetobacter baumannii]
MQSIVKHIFRHYLVALLSLGIFILSYFVGMVFGKLLFKNMNAVEMDLFLQPLPLIFNSPSYCVPSLLLGNFFFNSLKKLQTPFPKSLNSF